LLGWTVSRGLIFLCREPTVRISNYSPLCGGLTRV
jgi:hypothetical protein